MNAESRPAEGLVAGAYWPIFLFIGMIGCGSLVHINPSVREDQVWRLVSASVKIPRPRKPLVEDLFTVAVMDIQDTSSTLDDATLRNATEMLRGRLSAAGRFIVIDKSRQEEKIKALVRNSKKESYKACYDKKCQIPLGQALAADSILRSTVSCLGTRCLLSLELVDLGKEASIAGATADFDATPEGLAQAIRTAAAEVIL
jgi:hypothetical protein